MKKLCFLVIWGFLGLSAGRVGAAEYFVATNGNDLADGTNWATAVSSISTGIAKAVNAGDIVTVSNGTYTVTSQVSVAVGITVRSLSGPAATVVKASGSVRVFSIAHSNAIVRGFTIMNGSLPSSSGGGVYMAGGTLDSCVVRSNTVYNRGGGILAMSGTNTIRNCLIAGNVATRNATEGRAGGVNVEAGLTLIENCTITGNAATNTAGVCAYGSGSQAMMRNCIVYDNVSGSYGGVNGSVTATNCWTSGDPYFVKAGSGYGLSHVCGDYHLDMASACIDAGTNDGAAAYDLDGNPRPTDGNGDGVTNNDIGAYEALDATVGPLRSYVAAAPLSGFAPMAITFTAYPCGANTNGLYFQWDFKDGHTTNGTDLRTVTNLYAAFSGRAMLVLTNSGAEVATNYSRLLTVAPLTNYVSRDGGHVAPYESWGNAATTIQAAVDAAVAQGATATVVIVSNGTYTVGSQVSVSKGITVRSLNGPAVTIVNGNGASRGFSIAHSNAVVRGFTITNGYNTGTGGGAYMTGGTLENCVVIRCKVEDSGGRGGGVYAASGTNTIRNCLIAGNVATRNATEGGGGGVNVEAGLAFVENCTITGNAGTNVSGVRVVSGSAIVRNSIVYDNSPVNSGGTIAWTNCWTSDPIFVKAGSGYGLSHVFGDYHLDMSSPCIDAGTNAGAAAYDLDSNPRPTDGNGDGVTNNDIGCYEALDATVGPLRSYVAAAPLSGFEPLTIQFTAYPCGANTNGLYYSWNFGDGHTAEGANLPTPTNLYAAFLGKASLRLENDGSEVATNYSRLLSVSPLTNYVSLNGGHVAPYTTWGNAATTIQAAVDAAVGQGSTGTVVIVSNGTYAIGAGISVAKGIRVRSLLGPTATLVRANGSCRGFNIGHSNAVVEGVTITNAYSGDLGGAVYMTGGTLLSCIVRGNSCYNRGAGVCAASGTNTIRNCLISGNVATRNATEGGGGGVNVEAGLAFVENCTIAGNAGTNVAGVRRVAGTAIIRNSIVYNNSPANYGGTIGWTNSCTTPSASGAGNIDSDPLFVLAGIGYGLSHSNADYHLQSASLCINAGTNALVHPSLTTDLDGNDRIVREIVDMGAYESQRVVARGTTITIR